MRILCLTSRLPYPPNRGDRLRAFNFIKRLSQEHELSLVSFMAQPGQQEHLEPLRAYCQDVRVLVMGQWRSGLNVLGNLWRREPLQALYYRSGAMQRLIDQVLAEQAYDLVYVHLFRMAPYVAGLSDVYRVVDLTDVISQEVVRSLPYRSPLWRLIYKLERPRIERYERWVARTFEETWLISEADHQVLTAACSGTNVRVVPNGVDTGRFYPTGHPPEPNRLVFVGHMGVFHNVDAAVTLAQQILPRVRQRVPGCRLDVVGAEPSPRVQKLAQEPGVTVTGFVPDLNEHLNRAALFVAPLRFAAGVQNKVLEAMAAGRPVVTSSVVNAGLGAQPGRDLLVADGVEETVDHVVSLLEDEGRRTSVGRAGLEFVLQKYNWDHVARRVADIERTLPGA